MLDKAKALVAAIVGFAAAYITVKFGLTIPEDTQVWIAGAVTAVLSGFFTWLVPNKTT